MGWTGVFRPGAGEYTESFVSAAIELVARLTLSEIAEAAALARGQGAG